MTSTVTRLVGKGLWRLVRTPVVAVPLALVVLVKIGQAQTPDSSTDQIQAAAATGDSSWTGSLWWLGGAVAVLAVWAVAHRKSFMLLLGRPVYQAFRWLSIKALWRRWMEAHGLRTTRGEQVIVPRLTHVFSGPYVDHLNVRLVPGVSTDAFYQQVQGLKETLNAYDLDVVKGGPRKLRLTVYRRDTLADPIPALSIPTEAHWDRVTIGRQADGRPWTVRLLGRHLLAVGQSGAGKGSILWSIVRWLLPGIRDGYVQLWGIDPKGGVELGLGSRLFHRLVDDTLEEMAGVLEDCVERMDHRLRAVKQARRRKHTPTQDDPLIVLIIDEIASLTALAPKTREGKALADRIETALGHLLTKGRAPGFVCIGFVQDPRKEVLNLREHFGTKVALRLGHAAEVDLTLGQGMRAKGARCDEIPVDREGTGYVVSETSPTPMRVRAAYVNDAEITEMSEMYAPQVVATPVVQIAN